MPTEKKKVVVAPFTIVNGEVNIVIFSKNGYLSFQEVSYDKKVHGKIVDFETSCESLLGKQMKDGVVKVVFIDTPVKRWKNKTVSLFSKEQIVGETVLRLFETGFSMLYSEDTDSVNQNTEASPTPTPTPKKQDGVKTAIVFRGRDDTEGVLIEDTDIFLDISGSETVSEIIRKINGSASDVSLFFEKNQDIFARHLQTISSIEELSTFSAQYFSLEVLGEDGEHYFVSGDDQYPKAKEKLNMRLREFPRLEKTLFSHMPTNETSVFADEGFFW